MSILWDGIGLKAKIEYVTSLRTEINVSKLHHAMQILMKYKSVQAYIEKHANN